MLVLCGWLCPLRLDHALNGNQSTLLDQPLPALYNKLSKEVVDALVVYMCIFISVDTPTQPGATSNVQSAATYYSVQGSQPHCQLSG